MPTVAGAPPQRGPLGQLAQEAAAANAARKMAFKKVRALHPVYEHRKTPPHQMAHVENLGEAARLFCEVAQHLRAIGVDEMRVATIVREAAYARKILALAFLRPLWRFGDPLVRCMHSEENVAKRMGVYDQHLALERNRVADLRHIREAIEGLGDAEVMLRDLGYKGEAIRFAALKARLSCIRYPEMADDTLLRAGRFITQLIPDQSNITPEYIRNAIARRVIRDVSAGKMWVEVDGQDLEPLLIQALRHGPFFDFDIPVQQVLRAPINQTRDCTELIQEVLRTYPEAGSVIAFEFDPKTGDAVSFMPPCKCDPDDLRALERTL